MQDFRQRLLAVALDTALLLSPTRPADALFLVVRVINTDSTEGVEAPGPQGARREHTGSIRPTRNAVGRDASAVECDRICDTGHIGVLLALTPALSQREGESLERPFP